MKKEIKESKPKNPFLYIIQISKKHKRNHSNIISNKNKSEFIRTITPIKFLKNQITNNNNNNNFQLNISSIQKSSIDNKIYLKNLYKNISNQSPFYNPFKKNRNKSQNKQTYESIKLEINNLKKELNNKNKEIENSQNKINVLLSENLNLKNQINEYKEKIEELKKRENLNKENLLYNYFVEMNEQIMRSLNEDMPNLDNMTYEELLALEDKIGYVNKGFTKTQIEKIKPFKYTGNNISCVICQDNIEKNNEIKKLSCNHIFHSKCIDIWLSKEKICPFCKEEHKFTVIEGEN